MFLLMKMPSTSDPGLGGTRTGTDLNDSSLRTSFHGIKGTMLVSKDEIN